MKTFYGWRVTGAAFVLAMFGWGLGFYGPPVYLHAVQEALTFVGIHDRLCVAIEWEKRDAEAFHKLLKIAGGG